MVALWFGMLGVSEGDARDLLRAGPPARPPEAWFVLADARREGRTETECRAEVVVDGAGVPRDARAVGCPAVLAEGIRAAALRWRWRADGRQTAERIRVPVRAPSFSPRPRRGVCLVAFEIGESWPRALAEVPRRCKLGIDQLTTMPPAPTRSTAWCAVDLEVRDGAVASVSAETCAKGYATAAVETVRHWELDTSRDQRWRVLLGYVPKARR